MHAHTLLGILIEHMSLHVCSTEEVLSCGYLHIHHHHIQHTEYDGYIT